MNRTLVLLLAGGVGSRLNILGAQRAKPAVPFGGMYRIIDFTLSNAMNSGLDTVGVLTQYKPLSLMWHVGTGDPWDFTGRSRGAKILPPRTGQKDSDWYRGTADAVRQNMGFIRSHQSEHLLILSGDHIYTMDYAAMIDFHAERNADLTIAMMRVPWDETHHFGIGVTDENDRIVKWEEKPQSANSNLASMGIYVFKSDYLLNALSASSEHDFGKHIIPNALKKDRVFAYPFEGYWRDVGTIKALWQANMDLLDPASGIDLSGWRLRTNVEEEGGLGDRPPVYLSPNSSVVNSIISPGCRISGHVEDSVLSPGVRVEKGAVISNSVIMHDVVVGANTSVDRGILDKQVYVGPGAVVGHGSEDVANTDSPDHLSAGLVLVGKDAIVPAGAKIGRHCILHPEVTPADYGSTVLGAGATLRPMYTEA